MEIDNQIKIRENVLNALQAGRRYLENNDAVRNRFRDQLNQYGNTLINCLSAEPSPTPEPTAEPSDEPDTLQECVAVITTKLDQELATNPDLSEELTEDLKELRQTIDSRSKFDPKGVRGYIAEAQIAINELQKRKLVRTGNNPGDTLNNRILLTSMDHITGDLGQPPYTFSQTKVGQLKKFWNENNQALRTMKDAVRHNAKVKFIYNETLAKKRPGSLKKLKEELKEAALEAGYKDFNPDEALETVQSHLAGTGMETCIE